MVWLYVALFVAGIVLTIKLGRRRSRHVITAAIGTALAFLAILAGFSIGVLLAPLALVLLLVCVPRLRHHDRVV